MILCTLHPIKAYPDKCQIRLRPSNYVFSDEPGQSRPAGGALLHRSTSIVNMVNSNLLVGFDAQFPFDSEDLNCLWQKEVRKGSNKIFFFYASSVQSSNCCLKKIYYHLFFCSKCCNLLQRCYGTERFCCRYISRDPAADGGLSGK